MGKIYRIPYRDQELLPVKRDLIFKAIFLGDLELLASLLSSILDIGINADDIVITNCELPPVHEAGKLSRLDIRVIINKNKHVDVEIQLNNEHNMDKRSLFHLSRMYVEQMRSGMEYANICPAIVISILDFEYLPFNKYHSRFRMKETEENYELTDVFEIDFIELPKVPSEMSDNLKDLWMKFISADSEEVLDMLAKQSPVLDRAVKKLVHVSADEQLRYELDMREMAEMDYYSSMKKNYREGKEEGIQQGNQEKAISIAKNLLRMGMKESDIAEVVEMSLSKILEIKANNSDFL